MIHLRGMRDTSESYETAWLDPGDYYAKPMDLAAGLGRMRETGQAAIQAALQDPEVAARVREILNSRDPNQAIADQVGDDLAEALKPSPERPIVFKSVVNRLLSIIGRAEQAIAHVTANLMARRERALERGVSESRDPKGLLTQVYMAETAKAMGLSGLGIVDPMLFTRHPQGYWVDPRSGQTITNLDHRWFVPWGCAAPTGLDVPPPPAGMTVELRQRMMTDPSFNPYLSICESIMAAPAPAPEPEPAPPPPPPPAPAVEPTVTTVEPTPTPTTEPIPAIPESTVKAAVNDTTAMVAEAVTSVIQSTFAPSEGGAISLPGMVQYPMTLAPSAFTTSAADVPIVGTAAHRGAAELATALETGVPAPAVTEAPSALPYVAAWAALFWLLGQKKKKKKRRKAT